MSKALDNSKKLVGVELPLRKPRKIFSKLFALASAPTALRVIPIGDSLATQKVQQLAATLDRKMGGLNSGGVNVANTLATPSSAGSDLSLGTFISAAQESAQYGYWLNGDVIRIDAGGSTVGTSGGGNPSFTDIAVHYFTEPGAGTLNLVVGAQPWLRPTPTRRPGCLC